jgi:transcriptional regulator with XRE-family HTH domain
MHKNVEVFLVELTREQVVEIVERVERELQKRNISKTEFYKASGVASATFSQWRSGIRSPSMQSISSIARFLGVSVDWVLTGKEIEPEDTAYIREILRNRPGMKILFDAGKDVPDSVLLEAAAQIMKYKEGKQ